MAFIPGLVHASSNESVQCRDFHGMNLTTEGICHFIQTTHDCTTQSGFVDYLQLLYCHFGNVLPLGLTLLFLWWLVLIMGLAVAADNFFCPSLVVMSKVMRMSQNIAGVTLVAFGNGAPDVFSALAAIRNAKDGDIGLAIGALLGAGIFVTTVVAGAVCMVKPFNMMQRPFLRDVIFYIGSVFLTFAILYDGHISLAESIGYLVLYAIYVIVVIVGRFIYQRQKKQRLAASQCTAQNPSEENGEKSTKGVQEDEDTEEYEPIIDREQPPDTSSQISSPEYGSFQRTQAEQELDTPDNTSDAASLAGEGWRTGMKELLAAINPIPQEEWKNSRFYGKIYLVLRAPVVFVLTLTVPVVDLDQPRNNWNRWLSVFHCIISPTITLLIAKPAAAFLLIGGHFPVLALVFLVSCALAVLVALTSHQHESPKYHSVFAFAGFIIAVIWISTVANEIVNVLQTFGESFNLSNAVLGLTLLAWGNSIGDLIADTVMAKNGYPRAGISACFGGPLFNLLMGIGLPFTIGTAADGDFKVNFTLIQVVLISSLLFSLVASLLLVPMQKFNVGRAYAVFLFVVYLVFIVVALLVETNVITGSVHGNGKDT